MTIPKSTFYAYFDGKATPLQKKLLEDWLRQDPQNYEIFYEYLNDWEHDHPQFIPDPEAAFTSLLDRRQQMPLPTAEGNTVPAKRWVRLGLGTAALLLVTLGLGYWQRHALLYQQYKTAFGEVKKLTLNDGTQVTLNANSLLQVPRLSLEPGIRRVLLTGEATFSVTHTADHQKFIVSTPHHMEVEVLGTEFLVFSRKRGNKVILHKGKVVVRNLNHTQPETLTLKPGETVTLDKARLQKPVLPQSFENQTAWTNHRFVFDHQSMAEVAQQLHEQFGMNLEIRDSTLAQRRLVGSYEATNAEELVKTLAEMLQLKITQTRQTVQLSPQ